MHYLYIIKSEDTGKYYIGETNNIERRLLEHQQGDTSFGKRNKNSKLVYKKDYNDRNRAKKIEYFLKRQKSCIFIKKLIAGRIILPEEFR